MSATVNKDLHFLIDTIFESGFRHWRHDFKSTDATSLESQLFHRLKETTVFQCIILLIIYTGITQLRMISLL